MTASNLFVRPSAAYLVTDGAFYDAAGTILDFASKVTESERLLMAFAVSGRVKACDLAERMGHLNGDAAAAQEHAIEILPVIMRELRDANGLAVPEDESNGLNEFVIYLAMWSLRRQRAEGWICSTAQAWFGPTHNPYQAYSVMEIRTPPVGFPFLQPERDAVRLLEAQRRYLYAPELPQSFVGGFGELTTVTQHGITRKKVCHWPDRIGDKIRVPEAA